MPGASEEGTAIVQEFDLSLKGVYATFGLEMEAQTLALYVLLSLLLGSTQGKEMGIPSICVWCLYVCECVRARVWSMLVRVCVRAQGRTSVCVLHLHTHKVSERIVINR